MRIATILGTRPEAIKLAPLILEARRRPAEFELCVVSTGQHREMLGDALRFFDLVADHDLAIMTPDQTLASLTSKSLAACDALLGELRPDAVIVQGDTTSAMTAGLAAFYLGIPVAHVEAGLRTDRLDAPFPEELNRRIIGQYARWHFAPTAEAKQMLLRDKIDVLGGSIKITGNTVVDALLTAADKVRAKPTADPDADFAAAWKAEAGRTLTLVTGHRRENFGAPFEEFCLALKDLASRLPGNLLLYPVHLNPRVGEPVRRLLSGVANIRLCPPKDYAVFTRLMLLSDLIITDSGGVQEEAPSLGKPVLVTRETTERPEAVTAGAAKLVGTSREAIVRESLILLTDPVAYQRMVCKASPYGDGFASRRCLDIMLGMEVQDWSPPAVNS